MYRGGIPPDREVGRDKRRPARSEAELVQVGYQSVRRADSCDSVVRGIHNDVLSNAFTRGQISLPPGEDWLSSVLLNADIRRHVGGLERVEPDQPPVGPEDHRPFLDRTILRSEEDVARCCARTSLDRGRRGLQVWPGLELPDVAIDARRCRQRQVRKATGRLGHAEGEGALLCSNDVKPCLHSNPLTRSERLVWQEALAVAVGMRPDITVMTSAERPGH